MTEIQNTTVPDAFDPNLDKDPVRDLRMFRKKRLGRFFKFYRERSGVSAGWLAAQAELSSIQELERYESGEVDIPLLAVFSFSNYLNIPPDLVLDVMAGLYDIE